MTAKDVAARIARIVAEAAEGDYQTAHEMEDSLLVDALRHIAINSRCEASSELAKAALQVQKLQHTRWYA